MTAKALTFEGQTNGTAITSGNSGTYGDNPVSTVTLGTGCTINYSTAQARHGAVSAQVVGAANQQSSYQMSGFTGLSCSVSMYVFVTSTPSASTKILQPRNNSSSLGGVTLDTTLKLRCENQAGTTIFTSATAVPLNTWFRVEYSMKSGADTSTGESHFAWYLSDTGSAVDVFDSTTVNHGTTGAVLWNIGKVNTSAWAATIYTDSVRIVDGTTAQLGAFQRSASGTAPVEVGAAGSASAVRLAAGSAPVSVASQGTGKRISTAFGTAPIGVGGQGAATTTRRATGTAPVAVAASGTGGRRATASGAAPIAVTATGSASARRTGTGTSSVTVTTTGTGVARKSASGIAPIIITSTGQTLRRSTAAGAAPITVAASGSATVIPGTPTATGNAPIGIGAYGVARAIRQATGQATITLGGTGTATARRTTSGTAPIFLTAAGSTRTVRTAGGTAVITITTAGSATSYYPPRDIAVSAVLASPTRTAVLVPGSWRAALEA